MKQVPSILTEIAKGEKVQAPAIEAEIKESEKRIKRLLRPEEMKGQIEYFTKKAEQTFPPLPPQESFIKVCIICQHR